MGNQSTSWVVLQPAKLTRVLSPLAQLTRQEREKKGNLDAIKLVAEKLLLGSGDGVTRDSSVSGAADDPLPLWAEQKAEELVPLSIVGVKGIIVVCEEWPG